MRGSTLTDEVEPGPELQPVTSAENTRITAKLPAVDRLSIPATDVKSGLKFSKNHESYFLSFHFIEIICTTARRKDRL